MVHETAYHGRRSWLWAVVRLICALLAVAGVLWFVIGPAGSLFAHAATDFDPYMLIGPAILVALACGVMVGLPSILFVRIYRYFRDERRWRRGLRRGIAAIYDLRPGNTISDGATQLLTCRVEIRVEGMDTISADYCTDEIGPLDAPRFVQGATFACEISPMLPKRIRIWVFADPEAGELTGRYLDFGPGLPLQHRMDELRKKIREKQG